MTNNKIPELLAPAGSPEALCAAVSAGADAVYLSGRKYGARRLAKNFDDEGLKSAIYYCHARGVKVYVTLNTLIADHEMADALDELLFYYTSGADAVLIQDLGLIKAATECIPSLCLHASTQMTVNSTPGVVQACKMNLKRVVLARELSAQQIQRIYDSSEECRSELEIFAHGALCYCYSGQCIFSSLVGGRSGNRGMCAQPCRRKYTLLSGKTDDYGRIQSSVPVESKGSYLLSPRDLCTYDNLEEISKQGVKALKIEGRMKSADYVAIVVSVYRNALNDIKTGTWNSSENEKRKLVFAFNRLFTGGYIAGECDQEIMSQDRPDNRGMLLGDIVSCDSGTKNTYLKIRGPLVPELGDGLSVRMQGKEKDDGFILRPPFSVRGGYFHFKSPYPLEKGDLVYITRRQSVSALASEIAGRDGGVYEKIPVEVSLSFEGQTPVLKGSLSIFGHRFDINYKAEFEMAKAEKRPVMISDFEKTFGKTGGTPYSLSSFSADYAEDLFAPVSLLNELRREFFFEIEKETAEQILPSAEDVEEAEKNVSAFISGFKRSNSKSQENTGISFYADTTESVRGAVKAGCRRIYFEPDVDINGSNPENVLSEQIRLASDICRESGASLIWKWPRITNDSYLDFAVPVIDEISVLGISGIMTESIGAACAVRKKAPDIRIYASSGLNVFNSLTVSGVSDLFSGVTLSQELTGAQVRNLLERIPSGIDIEIDYIVHGSAELMVSENNLVRTSAVNRQPKGGISSEGISYAICDEKEHTFPIYTDSQGRTHIYNSAESCLIDSLFEILENGPDYIAVDGRRRGSEYAFLVVRAYMEAKDLVLSGGMEMHFETERIKKKLQKISFGGITEGHYRRGV